MERQFIGGLADFPLDGLRLLGGGGFRGCLCGFLHRLSFLILAKEKAGSPFQDFLLGSAAVRVAVIQFSMAVLRNRSPFLRVEVKIPSLRF